MPRCPSLLGDEPTDWSYPPALRRGSHRALGRNKSLNALAVFGPTTAGRFLRCTRASEDLLQEASSQNVWSRNLLKKCQSINASYIDKNFNVFFFFALPTMLPVVDVLRALMSSTQSQLDNLFRRVRSGPTFGKTPLIHLARLSDILG